MSRSLTDAVTLTVVSCNVLVVVVEVWHSVDFTIFLLHLSHLQHLLLLLVFFYVAFSQRFVFCPLVHVQYVCVCERECVFLLLLRSLSRAKPILATQGVLTYTNIHTYAHVQSHTNKRTHTHTHTLERERAYNPIHPLPPPHLATR